MTLKVTPLGNDWYLIDGVDVYSPHSNGDPDAALAVYMRGLQPFVPPPDPAPTRWYVPRLLVVERLEVAGLRVAAKQALAMDDYQKDRWDAATEIASDDAGVRALLTQIGADPDVILGSG